MTKKVIEGNRAEIEEWLKDSKVGAGGKKVVDLDLGKKIGYGVDQGEKMSWHTKAKVVLIKAPGNGKFVVLTSYPIK